MIVHGTSAARISGRMASAVHAQHAVTVLVGVDGDVSVNLGNRAIHGRVLVVAPNALHATRAPGAAVCFLFDPERSGTAALLRGGTGPVEGRLADAFSHIVSSNDPATLDAMLGEALELTRERPRRIDRRLAHAIELWHPESGDLLKVSAVAGRVGLSPAHFCDLFTRAIGITPRHYRLWTRLTRGFYRRSAGSATRLAIDAGFADLAHLSRTCRRFFGYTPTQLLTPPMQHDSRVARIARSTSRRDDD